MSRDDIVSEHGDTQLTRREAIRRGAALGGTLLWVVPVIQTVAMRPALAESTSPTRSTAIDQIGLNLLCDRGQDPKDQRVRPRLSARYAVYKIKYDGCVGNDCFENDAASFAACDVFSPAGTKASVHDLRLSISGPTSRGIVTVVVPGECQVVSSATRSGRCCQPGPVGTGQLEFRPASC